MIFISHSFSFATGITVAYSAPTRHGCLKVVENNYCASKRGMLSLSLSVIGFFLMWYCSFLLNVWLNNTPCSLSLSSILEDIKQIIIYKIDQE